MSGGVFGPVIDYDTLKAMPEYKDKNITQADVAKVARNLQYLGGYDTDCKKYVDDIRIDKYVSGVCTECVVYNATGDDLKFVLVHNYNGHIFCTTYPTIIKNGQWGGWLHVPTSKSGPSCAGVVYRGKNNGGTKMDWLLTWSVSDTIPHTIRERRHYENKDTAHFDLIHEKLEKGESKSKDEHNGCKSDTTIDDKIIAEYYATMTLTGP